MKPETIEQLILDIANLQGKALINPDSEQIEVKELPPISEQYYLIAVDKLSEAQSYMHLAKIFLENGE